MIKVISHPDGFFSIEGLSQMEYEDIGSALHTVLQPLQPGVTFKDSYLRRAAAILVALPVPEGESGGGEGERREEEEWWEEEEREREW